MSSTETWDSRKHRLLGYSQVHGRLCLEGSFEWFDSVSRRSKQD